MEKINLTTWGSKMLVKVIESEEKWKGDKASLYLVTVEAEGKRYKVRTWSRTIGNGVGRQFDVVSEKRKNKMGEDESFIKQNKAGGGNGFYKKGDNLACVSLECACRIAAAEIGAGEKLNIGAMLNMADGFYTWLKQKE